MKTAQLLLLLTGLTFLLVACEENNIQRNPFGVADVNDPFGADVLEFYNDLELPFADETDANAENWANLTNAIPSNLQGDWAGRWSGGTANNNWVSGTAELQLVDETIYILYTDNTNEYLTEARFENDSTLVGRYVNLGVSSDSSPWVGILKDARRIDGIWAKGRWDYRR